MKYSLSEIDKVLTGRDSRLPQLPVNLLLTDSRSLTSPTGTLFFALSTPQNDGHRYISDLYAHGVRCFVVDHFESAYNPEHLPDAYFIKVDDTKKALQRLARFHREKFQCPVVGITGSRGKTVVKEWLARLLEPGLTVTRSPRSYNSQIGVPLSVWEMSPDTDVALFEAGISQPGEMGKLRDIIQPTIALLTNVGSEHADAFPSRLELAREKAQLVKGAHTVIYNADDKVIEQAVKEQAYSEARLIGWSLVDTDAPLYARVKGNELTYRYLGGPEKLLKLPFSSDIHIQNALTSLAVLLTLQVNDQDIASRFADLTPVTTRLEVMDGVNECRVFHDSYTSDIPSLVPALDFMSRSLTRDMKMTAILSDLVHDSDNPSQVYQSVVQTLKDHGVTRLIGVGEEFMKFQPKIKGINAAFYPTTDDLLDSVSPANFLREMILVKGAPQYDFASIAEFLEARQHETVMEVNLDAMVSNFNFFRSKLKPTTGIVCMLKASGYGAGSLELARALQSQGAAYVAVAVHDEGVELRHAGITMPIMVLNPKVENFQSLFTHHLEPEIYSFEFLERLIEEARDCGVKDYPVHLKLDTGMHRLGFRYEELPRLVEILKSQNEVRPKSVFSHLCAADDPAEDDYTRQQFEYFDKCCDFIQQSFHHHILRHILNSTGITRFPEQQHDLVRLGIGLYGVKTMHDGSQNGLRPVSSVRSPIISLRHYQAGETVGYNRRGVLSRPSVVATIPIGYADGLNRHLGYGNASFLIRGKMCPIIGSICMDACMVDVTDVPVVAVGDMAEVFGDNIPVEKLSDTLGTIPYEILTSISTRIKRIYYRE